MAFLEWYYGAQFSVEFPPAQIDPSLPDATAASILEAAYFDIFETLAARFLAQSALSSALLVGASVPSTTHPFVALSPLDSGRTAAAPELNGSIGTTVSDLVDSVAAGNLSAGNAAMVIRLLRFDLGTDDDSYFAAVEVALRGDADQATASSVLGVLGGGFANVITGTAGDDTLQGTRSADILEGGLGNDTLNGGRGDDTYLFSRGDGVDTIIDTNRNDADRLLISGYTQSDAIFRAAPTDPLALEITFVGTSDAIIIVQALDRDVRSPLDEVAFDDGTALTLAAIRQLVVDGQATAGDDTITGSFGDETLTGGLGNDTLNGGRGDDTYVYAAGDGDDVIVETGREVGDRLLLNGIAPSTVTLAPTSPTSSDILVTFGGLAGSVTLQDNFDTGRSGLVDLIEFSDGTIWDRAEIERRAVDGQNTSGDDTIVGTRNAETFERSVGNDTLDGRRGADRYLFGAGDGQDTIQDTGIGGRDRIVLVDATSPFVLVNASSSDPTDLVLRVAGRSDTITVEGQFTSDISRVVEVLEFADGTTWNANRLRETAFENQSTDGDDTLLGTAQRDSLSGGLGNDTISGLAGGDTYLFGRGDGMDVIDDNGSGGEDTIAIAGFTPAETTVVRASGANDDVVFSFANSTDTLTVIGGLGTDTADRIETVQFEDGTLWDLSAFRNRAAADQNTAGDDTIFGSSGADTFTGGAGNDTLLGGESADTYVITAGEGSDVVDDTGTNGVDRVVFTDLLFADATLQRDPALSDHILITLNANGDSVLLLNSFASGTNAGVEEVEFAGGTVLSGTLLQDVVVLSEAGIGNETIIGTNANDALAGGLGNDRLEGRDGSDTYVFAAGDGQDVIEDNGFQDTDVLRILGYTAAQVQLAQSSPGSDDLVITFAGSTDRIEILNTLDSDVNDVIERIELVDDGTVWDQAGYRQVVVDQQQTAGDDTVIGNLGDQTLRGGLGNDRL
ncbi:MAG: calcium-binding protein, partial [Pseudomonadota bacterium]